MLNACTSIDPAEKFNRKVFGFNEKVDQYLLKPVATGYNNYTPYPIKSAINNIYSNIEDIYSIANNILQLKPKGIAEDTMRVAINTVLGLGGTIDIASKAGIMRHREDFGQTMGYWGIPNGPYLILPILGPSTLRDSFGTAITIGLGPSDLIHHDIAQVAYNTLNIVRLRAGLLDITNSVDDLALDKYNFLRNAYLQKRKYDIYDGEAPDELDDVSNSDANINNPITTNASSTAL
jgi:phospholipid-binding lipoprotein MlaA